MGGIIAHMHHPTTVPAARPVVDWQRVDHVLLDLDGTLLDLHYDRHVWHEVVPAAWGASRGLDPRAARSRLEPRFRAVEGTLDWYCIDYWSRELQLDLRALKRADPSRIDWLPGARNFVRALRSRGLRTVLATNSHPDVLQIKHEHTGVMHELDASFSAHVFGVPKEHADFWQGLRAAEPFDPARTLFVDDNPPMLRAAGRAGIAQLVVVCRPDSSLPANRHDEFAAVEAVAELLG
jgi:putative hydrolase of the HAD superfamily